MEKVNNLEWKPHLHQWTRC